MFQSATRLMRAVRISSRQADGTINRVHCKYDSVHRSAIHSLQNQFRKRSRQRANIQNKSAIIGRTVQQICIRGLLLGQLQLIRLKESIEIGNVPFMTLSLSKCVNDVYSDFLSAPLGFETGFA